MAQQDLEAALTNFDTLDSQMLSDPAANPALTHEVHAPVEPATAIAEQVTPEAAAAEAATAPAETPAPAAVTPDPAAPTAEQRIAELTKELAALKAAQTEAPAAAAAKSEAAQKREARVTKLIEVLGDDHPLVEIERERNAEAAEAEAKLQQNTNVANEAAINAARVQHTQTLPILKDLYSRLDANPEDADAGELYDIVAAISTRIVNDPKFAGTPAGKPHTAEHYKAVEERAAARLPELKAKFYPSATPPAEGVAPKPNLTLRDVPGGNAPTPTVKPKKTLAEIAALAVADPFTSIDELLKAA